MTLPPASATEQSISKGAVFPHMRRVLPLIVLVLLGFAPAPFPKPDPSKEDLRKMQGKWFWIYTVKDGNRKNEMQETIWLMRETGYPSRRMESRTTRCSFLWTPVPH
jgi:hypothetical protein